jgi:phytoene dehydrogenase-like protein
MESTRYDAIIIGSGMGGLAAGLTLQNKNPKLKTLILEQHNIPGGSVNGFKRKGYYFDSGAEGLVFCGEGHVFRKGLEKLDIFHEYIPIEPVEVMQYPNKKVTMFGNIDKFIQELEENFPEEKQEIHDYFKIIKDMNDEYYSLNLDKFEPSIPIFIKIALTRPTLRKYGLRSFKYLLDKYISNPDLRKILAVYSLWLGVQPDKISAASAAIVFNSPFFHGNFYPKGGMLAFANNLASVYESKGGKIRYKSQVKKIIVENKRAVGVILDNGEKIHGKWIISNADLKKTIFDYVGIEHFKAKYHKMISQLKESISGFAVFLGLNKNLDDQHSHIAYNVDAEDYLQRLFNGFKGPEEVLIRIPENIDPSLKNNKGSSVVLLTMAPYEFDDNWGTGKEKKKNSLYKKLKEKYADALIKIAEKAIPNLSKHIVVKEIATPLTYERYIQTTNGAWYGPMEGQKLPKFKSPIKNLLFAGGNVDGAGVPTCFFSGVDTAQYILKKIE